MCLSFGAPDSCYTNNCPCFTKEQLRSSKSIAMNPQEHVFITCLWCKVGMHITYYWGLKTIPTCLSEYKTLTRCNQGTFCHCDHHTHRLNHGFRQALTVNVVMQSTLPSLSVLSFSPTGSAAISVLKLIDSWIAHFQTVNLNEISNSKQNVPSLVCLRFTNLVIKKCI